MSRWGNARLRPRRRHARRKKMSDKIYEIPRRVGQARLCRRRRIPARCTTRSIADPERVLGRAGQAHRLVSSRPTKVKNTSFDPDNVSIKWFEDGILNVSYNCIDRHLAQARRPDRDHLGRRRPEGRQEDHLPRTARRGLPLRQRAEGNRGVKKGDRVTIYLPMIPEAAYAMLACARIGAIHSVVFGGFSPDSLAGRIEDCESNVVITADEGLRGGRKVPLKANTDEALDQGRRRRPRDRRAAHRRRRSTWSRAATSGIDEARRDRDGRVPARGDERRGSAVHPLHLGLDRQAEGRAAHDRRLSASTPR